ncbi:MAG: MFS transporter [Sumerlaeia bacterium]
MRSFVFLNYLVFVGNFTDNALRLLVWLTFGALALQLNESPDSYRALVGVCYTAPWLFFSLIAGQLADRFSKRHVVLATRLLDVVIWMSGMIAYAFFRDPYLLLGMLFALGVRMSLFGPPSMGLIAEILPPRRVTWGNSWIDGLTFLGAILGTAFGGLVFDLFDGELLFPLLFLSILSSSSIIASLLMHPIPPAEPTRRINLFPLKHVRQVLSSMRQTPGMSWSFAGIVFWWALAALALQVSMKFAEDTLLMEGFGTSRFFIYVGIGVGSGSIMAGIWCRRHLELGYVPLAGIMMGVCSLVIGLVPPSELFSGVMICVFGFFAGWFIIPLKGFLQRSAQPEARGGLLGTLNFFQYGSIFVSSGFIYYFLTEILALTAPQIFVLLGILLLVASAIIFVYLRNVALRCLIYIFLNTVYKIRIQGVDNIPEHGGALIVSNHMSFADGILMAAAVERPIFPIIYDEIYNNPFIKPIVDLIEPIPINHKMKPRELIETLNYASEKIRSGNIVIIFAEGQISRVGFQVDFRKGIERIMRDLKEPIIPVALDGLRGQFLGVDTARKLVTFPKKLRAPISMTFGEPMPAQTKPHDIHQRILCLRSAAWELRRAHTKLLHHEALTFPLHWARDRAFYDLKNPEGLPRWKFAVGIIVFALKLRKRWHGEERIGICLPPSIASAVLNHAVLLAGKVPVNLNYTASPDVLAKICDDAEIKSIFTSKEFEEKANFKLPFTPVYLEDLAEKISPSLRKTALKLFLTKSTRQLERIAGNPHWKTPISQRLNQDASIIYSSGSTGIPKGVRLSHWNLATNIQSTLEVFHLTRSQSILAMLPFFHSIGTMIFIFLPHKSGLRASYLPNPLDMGAIAETVSAQNITCLVATPTFLQAFLRRVAPSDFGSLNTIIAGAEKLRPALAEAFEKRFGLPICEGYGSTECSPVVACNTPDYRAQNTFQRSRQYGTVGMCYPGVVIEIRDIDTNEVLGPEQPGMIYAKGPNVMKGYLNQPEKTAEVLQDGWYRTGDIGLFGEDGFLRITDRLSRFSKIGGEMVPHVNIENRLLELLNGNDGYIVVTSIPDDKKGERLIVLFTHKEELVRKAFDLLAADPEFPNLWKPKWADFFNVEGVPMLGTGKTDLRRVRELAVEQASKA